MGATSRLKMIYEHRLEFYNSTEFFFVDGNLVANQPTVVYRPRDWQGAYYDVRHFFCYKCGSEWGLRIDPNLAESLVFPAVQHRVISAKCPDCGGRRVGDLLEPWEHRNLDLLGPNVLANLFLEQTEEV